MKKIFGYLMLVGSLMIYSCTEDRGQKESYDNPSEEVDVRNDPNYNDSLKQGKDEETEVKQSNQEAKEISGNKI